MATSSTVARWELAHRIKVRRHELGISVDQIAKHLGFTRNFFSAVENERSMLATEKLEVLLLMLEFDDGEREEMMALDEAARQRGWWEAKEVVDLLGEDGSRYLGLEQAAVGIRTFDSLLVPGLLQIGDYMRLVMQNDPIRSRIDVDKMVDVRERRQRSVLETGVRVVCVITEAALRQTWGSAEVRRRQMQYIQKLALENVVTLRILTFETPPGILASSATLLLLDFASPHLPSIGYQEAVRDLGSTIEGEPHFERLQFGWDQAADNALGHADSCSFIDRLLIESDT